MARPLIALLMIVKDEAANIERTVESCRDVVDQWYVFDTGSTDGTPDIVRNVFAKRFGVETCEHFSGVVRTGRPVLQKGADRIDYAATRNRCLDLHREIFVADLSGNGPAVFTLFLNGDETLCGGDALRAFLESKRGAADGAYSVEMRQGSTIWSFPRILRTAARWRYEGAVHEVPVNPLGVTGSDHFEGESVVNGTPCIPGVHVVHVESDPARHLRRLVEFDLPTLEGMAEDSRLPVHLRSRALLYLAQTHEEVAESHPREPGSRRLFHQYAAMASYRRLSETCAPIIAARIYVDYADWHYLNVAERLEVYSPREMFDRLGAIIQRDPLRPESRYMAAAAAVQFEDARVALLLAVQAADAAREAREKPLPLPTDARVEWSALRIAVACAKALDKEDLARRMAARAVAAGGPREAFVEFIVVTGEN